MKVKFLNRLCLPLSLFLLLGSCAAIPNAPAAQETVVATPSTIAVSPSASPTASPVVSPSPSGPKFKFVPQGQECPLPQLLNQSLVDQVASVPLGTSPEDAVKRVRTPPDKPYEPGSGNTGSLLWTHTEGERTIEVKLNFDSAQVTGRDFIVVKNLGSSEQTQCLWSIE